MCPMNPVPDLIGKTFVEAKEIAEKASYYIRIVKFNDNCYICTRDFRTDRINVELKGNNEESAVIVKQDIG